MFTALTELGSVVICFQISIFDPLETAAPAKSTEVKEL